MVAALLALGLPLASCWAAPPQPSFYLPFEGSTSAALAGGSRAPVPNVTAPTDTILQLLSLQQPRFLPGKVGRCYDIGDQPLVYECAGNFRADEGTCSFWVSPEWRGDDRNLYSTLFGAADWGMVYKYEDQTSLTFATAKPDADLYYDCGAPDISSWQPGEWHHVVVTWSRQRDERRLFVDGQPEGRAPFPYCRQVKAGPLFVGAGCTLYPQPVAYAKLDEFALWDEPLDDGAVEELFSLGTEGKPLAPIEVPPVVETGEATPLPVVHPASPPPPDPNVPAVIELGPRTRVELSGWWQFLPATAPLAELPTAGWGLTRLPGHWTAGHDTLRPDGQPAGGQWEGQPLSRYPIAYLQRTFVADAAWQARSVVLQLGGVDGLAQVFLNGRLLGWLPAWEPESYDIGSALQYGQENTLTIVLRTRGGSPDAGVYGEVGLCITSGALINDVSIRPHVPQGQIEFACDAWYPGQPTEAVLEFDVVESTAPERVVRRFTHACRLAPVGGDQPALYPRLQRITATFDWPEAHPWTLDDPFLYDLTVSLRIGDALRDRTAPVRFGSREFARRGADLLLNGKPVHLRGHQIDLPWGDQIARVQELKAAGLNCLELSGPISSSWYAGTPYQRALFEDILSYCDEHGLIAIPILPDLQVIQDRVFEPAVAELYQRRLAKHIATYGNHAGIGLWYMHFNLAGYDWYLAPSKLDGSYRPEDPGFRAKERFALEAQRLAQALDARPIYHHACGNFGDIFTCNLYLGPNIPTQEREEWPSAWAEKRPFPFIACEHCCLLIPYWFRPRQFPLEVVYAGEPIFDELSAMYLGPAAYGQITPELFDLYDVGRPPRGTRMRELIRHHPGYQAVKSQVAQHSLRAWRTYGVSGIIFNAENWDFKDDEGRPLPMMQALARYFGDTDLYVVGPPGDWPSKDHSFFAGETVRKQVVLLNDLTRDIPCTLQWALRDAGGQVYASGRIEATSEAGKPTFYPLELTAPQVAERNDLTLAVEPVSQPKQDFQPETFPLQVFPAERPVEPAGPVLLYDPVGDTAAVLRRAAVQCDSYTRDSDPARAALLIVGRRSWDAGFLALAEATNLDQAVRDGLRVLVFEQTTASPFGLRLEETSTRQTFIAAPDHPLLRRLQAADLQDLRGASDLLEPYPDAPPETEHAWPARGFKWGNRGIVATYVYVKPHYAPFRPVLQCGFDLVQSPLLEARCGRGSITLCQVDVTPRYGADPVSTALVDNLLTTLTQRGSEVPTPCSFVGESARRFLSTFGVTPTGFRPDDRGVIVVGGEPPDGGQMTALEQAARDGATVLLLPQAECGPAFGLRLREQRLFGGRLGTSPLLTGLDDGDVYLKQWATLSVASDENGWESLIQPGLLAAREIGAGRLLACRLDPESLGPTRARVKLLRFWNLLLANLGVERSPGPVFGAPPTPPYEDNQWEQIPPYMDW